MEFLSFYYLNDRGGYKNVTIRWVLGTIIEINVVEYIKDTANSKIRG